MYRALSCCLALLLGVSIASAQDKAKPTAPPEPEGLTSLFNGKDLTGWDGDPRLWSVKEGCIRGETTQAIAARGNTFLIRKDLTVKDFELRLSYRCGTANNSGIQYRSKHWPFKDADANKWVVGGYQAEVRNDGTQTGFIYDEKGKRGRMCFVGEKVTWDAEKGKQITGTVNDKAAIAASFKKDDWNDYVIIGKGNHIQHFINGVQIIDFTDGDPKLALSEGIIALQLHAGAPMWVEFKNVRVKHN